MTDLTVRIDGLELAADWLDVNPGTRRAIDAALPLTGDAARWGDELYFGTDVEAPAEETAVEVPVGTLAYWPAGNAVCLFWGPTPASTGASPRAASPVSPFARLDDAAPLAGLDGAARVELDRSP